MVAVSKLEPFIEISTQSESNLFLVTMNIALVYDYLNILVTK